MTHPNTPLYLIILDGWGERAEVKDNGIAQAKKPYFDSLIKNYPHTLIDASGPAVGLPVGIMGNSEVGHMNIGAGRIVYSGLSQIYQAIAEGSFERNQPLGAAIEHALKNSGTLHLMGLLSDGAVHSHQDHLYALIRLAKARGLKKIAIHVILDGRDTAPTDGIKYVTDLQKVLAEEGVGRIASVSGRYWAMDRDQRWERVEKAFRAMAGLGTRACDVAAAVKKSYAAGVGDEFFEPLTVVDENDVPTTFSENDGCIFFNFRADRAREITRALTQKSFDGFDRGDVELPGCYVCMAPYDESLGLPVAFKPSYPKKILGEILAEQGFTQLRISETEKYAHVTFFFNGGREQVFPGEDRILIKSPKEVATYDLKPEMSAPEVCAAAIADLEKGGHAVTILNFANADMVGHTAKPQAIVKAIETLDACLSRLVPEILKRGGCALITADHGNAEEMVDAKGEPMTAHTLNLVPLILVGEKFKNAKLASGGRLCDLAPTLLKILGIEPPSEMTGNNLVTL